MADFQTWNSIGGSGNTYTGIQGQCNIDANDNLAQAYSNTWVLAFDGTNYTGNILKITADDNQIDLNKTTRYDSSGNNIGDWKDQIQSFILYKQKPSWWDTIKHVAPTNEQLFELQDAQVLLCEDENFLGENIVIDGPYACSDTANIGYTTNSRYLSGAYAVSSLKTGPNAWLIIFDHTQMTGCFLKIPPNTPYSNLNNEERNDLNGKKQGDWNDQTNSFLIYNDKPEFWDTDYASPYIDQQSLYNLYPYPTSSVGDNPLTYMVEDSTYYITYPVHSEQTADQNTTDGHDDTTHLPAAGWTRYHVKVENNVHGGWNDTVEFDMYFDNAGNIVQIQNFNWTSSGAFEVPSAFIKAVDITVASLGVDNTWETLGISDVVAEGFIDVFDMVCSVFNTIADKIFKFTDNGGEFYLLPVVCHTINRICATVAMQYNVPLYTDPSNPRNAYALSFDNSRFPNTLNSEIGDTVSGWQVKNDLDGGTLPFNQVVEYLYGGYKYRTWYQESSVSASFGMFVSCKVDYEIDSTHDDHIIILMGFKIPGTGETAPILTFAQAIVQLTNESENNVMTPAYSGLSGLGNYSNDIIGSVYNYISANVPQESSEPGRIHLADVTKANMNAVVQCMSYGLS